MRSFSLSPRRLCLLVILLSTIFLAGLLLLAPRRAETAGKPTKQLKLALKPGDHIAFLGNALGERMQHDGWLEAYIHSRYPKHDLSFRNLCFPADELTLRLRSANFGSPDKWLTDTRSNVIFAFFGYNESFGDKEGLPKFKKDLEAFVKDTLKKKYNGTDSPRLVLFSPIAHEDLKDPNLPDGKENNRRLELYTDAMSEIAAANKVPFVDLFTPTKALYAKVKKPLTINGIHLTAEGNLEVAKIIDEVLFAGKPEGKRDDASMGKLRKAILDKNFYWFHRYRTTDGYSIYGGRAGLTFVDAFKKEKQTNRVVMKREMEVLDVMTANRDKAIWQRLKGADVVTVDDSNTPAFIPVLTNKPGPLLGGKHRFLDPEKAIESMTVAKGMKVNLFASEKQFKDFVNPVQMSFDNKGRLWVAVWPTYPHWKPKEEMNDKILILEDTDGDGKADKCTVFADKLHNPTGFEFWNGGVLVAQAPDIWFLKDTKGTGKADLRKRVVSGIDSADTHHTSNSFVLDPGGAVYFQEGTFHHTAVETPYGKPERCVNAGVFRYEPRTQKFEVYISHGFANPHGHIFDKWGQDIVVDGTSSRPYHAPLFSGHLEYPDKHRTPPIVWTPPSRPCPGMEVLSSRHFPDSMQGDVLVPNVIGFQGIFRIKLKDDGASFTGTKEESILSSKDPNFRPSDVKIGPDGAIYFIDWHNPIIGHMQHNLRDPSRDREHGRVYRVTYTQRKLLKPVKIAGEPIDKVLELLKEPEDRTRYRARIELTARPTDKVIEAAKKWIAKLDKKSGEYEHHLLEALWLHQSHNVVNIDLLKQLLTTKDFRARAAATRVLCYQRERVPDALALLRKQAGDVHPRVRMEAVRAASFFTVPEALEVALIAEEKPMDQYIKFVHGETLRALNPIVKKAIADKKKIKFFTAAGARYFLKTVSTDDLLKLERNQTVYLELLFRRGVRDEYRREALTGLAKLQKKDELEVLLEAIRNQDSSETQDESVAFDLARLMTGRRRQELTGEREALVKLATSAKQAITRQLGYVVLVAADSGTDKAWALAIKSNEALNDFVSAVSFISDPGHRAGLYGKVSGLLTALPKGLDDGGKVGPKGRIVRITLPGSQRTLTLAEVEVYSGGKNIARKGKAKQSSTAHGGNARRAIDGNKNGNYNKGGQTHTQEGTDNPWWEVDLGGTYEIEKIEIYNRTDGALGDRLKGYTVQILDGGRKTVFEKKNNPTPSPKAVFTLGKVSSAAVVRRAAMKALPGMRGHEADAVKALVKFLKDEQLRADAVKALQRIPAKQWPADATQPTIDSLLAIVRKVPEKERTATSVLDMMQLTESLSVLLPAAKGKAVRKELGELGVRVIRLGTLVEQMSYDKERIVVQAGKQVEIIFENSDTMPHNFVIIQPGSLEEIGNLAEKTAQQPGSMARHYVPVSKKVLEKSKLLQPRETERLSFKAPTKPGVYPYVCTYPGHWRRMHGALYVVSDLEEYLGGPEKYLAKNPLKIEDTLLKFNRPRKEWKFDELASAVKTLEGRSFANGKQMFTVAACISCHKFGGAGREFGPDLTKLDPKWGNGDVLKHILEPSLKIDDKYRTWQFNLSNGKTLTGMILKETPAQVEVIENPLASEKPMVIKKGLIDKRIKSEVSLMPKGALDKLTREEILDLVAYIVSGANPKHKAFKGHGH